MDIAALYDIYKKHPVICTDSRKVEEGVLFFALKGDNFDGNKFAKAALEAGAAYVIVDDPNVAEGDGFILVNDVLETMQKLARHHRDQFDFPVIGLTGSNGKTTTKELLAAVLAQKYKVHATSGNFNNHIGVPLTLLSMPDDTEIAVIEMGANGLHEIGFLCGISAPTHGFVTNVGKAHLEGFGSFEGVIKTKAEIYDWLAENDGIGFVNQNESHLGEMASQVKEKILYGKGGKVSLKGASPFVEIEIAAETGGIAVKTRLIGAYNFNNILTAITLGQFFNVPDSDIATALENYQPSNNRSQLLEKEGNTFIMDSYNANPVSMEKALMSFSDMEGKGRKKIAIVGDMLELGEVSEQEHNKIVQLAKAIDIDTCVFVGQEFGKTVDAEQLHFKDSIEAKNWYEDQAFSNAMILLKGSRGIRLEQIIQ
ncbi:MAG: UDP-N-acetylmuramoyl-tripeptide--D-alanyl-D-alanine ligase [Bacteroidetes bacterium]|nr:MAG: UDP-N-acetylmuramoyl-tripeptide--D-alanyl-D-alanine ligase [Bacteroidota bacterium]